MAAPGNMYPNVFMVDTHTAYPPPLPPKPIRYRKRSVVQPMLLALVALALCGMVVEACFIYRLYSKHPQSEDTQDTQQASRQDKPIPKPQPNPVVLPSKPLAHMAGGQRHAADGLMLWNIEGETILHEMEYKDGVLTIQQEGYYFVYSKIYFVETHKTAHLHSVVRTTTRYSGEMVLLMSREYRSNPAKNVRTNSYLGGMFHFFKNDTIFVRVNNTQVILSTPAENYFGAYMV
ncbi:tumor necrosis factor ligand superfamily member 14 [Clupea harengus]|uniref:Tumor necrosis factor ligand superfamily member 14 n=1 Tax=Clupea harengus TaxID=7950 RepID=A0A6P8G759_CLUHA|nr:tumor necrosis factor ligand superfamily member 14 [Clupea harengus]